MEMEADCEHETAHVVRPWLCHGATGKHNSWGHCQAPASFTHSSPHQVAKPTVRTAMTFYGTSSFMAQNPPALSSCSEYWCVDWHAGQVLIALPSVCQRATARPPALHPPKNGDGAEDCRGRPEPGGEDAALPDPCRAAHPSGRGRIPAHRCCQVNGVMRWPHTHTWHGGVGMWAEPAAATCHTTGSRRLPACWE